MDAALRSALYEPIPGGARFAYVFGSGLLFIFISQVITGIFLALYYVPSADHAHTTVSYITKAVTAGSFLRSLHAYGASAMIIVLLLHLSQTYIYGAYKGPREILWVSGCVLFALVLGMAFTGYLLPWDQRAYFATAVGTNAASEVPLIGETLKRMMRGGTEMGTLTISRFFVAHIFFIPACIFALVAAHILLFRKAGAAGPPDEDAYEPKKKTELFYPRQVLMDLSFTALLIIALGILCFFVPMQLGPSANPADAQYIPASRVVLPAYFSVAEILARSGFRGGHPDNPHGSRSWHRHDSVFRSQHRTRPWKRPIAMGAYGFVLLALVGLGLRSQYLDATIPALLNNSPSKSQKNRITCTSHLSRSYPRVRWLRLT